MDGNIMIELAALANQLQVVVDTAPKPLMLVLVPALIICLATVAVAVATLIEAQIPSEEHSDH